MNEQEIMQRLKQPFLPSEIEWRVGSTNQDKSKGIALAYVTNRAIQNRLDEVFGTFGWKNEFREWKGTSQLCGISIRFNDEWITKWDGADDSNMEATKGGLSDAMKRAAYQWGIGRYLYELENVWCEIVPAGRSYRLKYDPKLPEWALPSDFKYDQPPVANYSAVEEPKREQLNQSHQQHEQPSTTDSGQSSVKMATEGQVKLLSIKRKAAGFENMDKINEHLGIKAESMKDIPMSKVNDLIKFLDANKLPA